MKTQNTQNQEAKLPVIIAWLGTTDVRHLNKWREVNGLPQLLGYNGGDPDSAMRNFDGIEKKGNNGPIRTLTDAHRAEKIFILVTSKYYDVTVEFQRWVKRGTTAECVCIEMNDISDPTDYTQVYDSMHGFLQEHIYGTYSTDRLEFNISPGTPAMQTITLLMTKYELPGARAFRTLSLKDAQGGEQIHEVKLPYALTREKMDRVGEVTSIRRTKQLSEAIAISREFPGASILLLGETGTGKTVSAQEIHNSCCSDPKKFIIANCAELAQGGKDLFRAEMFGAKKGAYTGAVQDMPGLFRQAEGGTLFLDEIGEIPMESQTLLLRALQNHEANPVGGSSYRINNVRIIAATNRDLIEDVKNGRFRRDLYYRIAVFPLPLESLREIRGSAPEEFDRIVDATLAEINQSEKALSKNAITIDGKAMELIRSYRWPGNRRQLHHALYIAAIRAYRDSGVITADIIRQQMTNMRDEAFCQENEISKFDPNLYPIPSDLDEWVLRCKKSFITRALEECGGKIGQAAERVGISYQRLLAFKKEHIDKGG
ncbi:MAG: sigma 54-interacting transcriptional regulator [Succinivibrionaceae bacterium]|nr:sigma 54-interacting transcriptional regulator [Succinivibrionaceae bacterium]